MVSNQLKIMQRPNPDHLKKLLHAQRVIPGMQDWFRKLMQINILYPHIQSELKKITATDRQKASDKTQLYSHNENTQKTRNRENFSQHNKGHL